MTHTVTKTYTKQNDATFWPWEKEGYTDGLNSAKASGKLISHSGSDDGNTHTTTQVWSSKSDYNVINTIMNSSGSVSVSTDYADYAALAPTWKTYMTLNNISCRTVEEDGTVHVFNSSAQKFELE